MAEGDAAHDDGLRVVQGDLLDDGVVLFLTIYRSVLAFNAARGFAHTRLWRVIAKDGLMYFFVMFAANLTTVLMYIVSSLSKLTRITKFIC